MAAKTATCQSTAEIVRPELSEAAAGVWAHLSFRWQLLALLREVEVMPLLPVTLLLVVTTGKAQL